jgi:hypothetical protein
MSRCQPDPVLSQPGDGKAVGRDRERHQQGESCHSQHNERPLHNGRDHGVQYRFLIKHQLGGEMKQDTVEAK